MKTYLNKETNEKLEAVQWNGDSSVFQDWQHQLGHLPFTYQQFPRLRIQNTISKIDHMYIVDIGGWVIRDRKNLFKGLKNSQFKLNYTLIE